MSPPTAQPDPGRGGLVAKHGDDGSVIARVPRAAYPFDSAPGHEVSIGGGAGGTLPYIRCSPCQVLVYEPQGGPAVSLATVVAFLRDHGVFP